MPGSRSTVDGQTVQVNMSDSAVQRTLAGMTTAQRESFNRAAVRQVQSGDRGVSVASRGHTGRTQAGPSARGPQQVGVAVVAQLENASTLSQGQRGAGPSRRDTRTESEVSWGTRRQPSRRTVNDQSTRTNANDEVVPYNNGNQQRGSSQQTNGANQVILRNPNQQLVVGNGPQAIRVRSEPGEQVTVNINQYGPPVRRRPRPVMPPVFEYYEWNSWGPRYWW